MLLKPHQSVRVVVQGYTIIELMIAITISLAVLAGLASLFANNSRAHAEIERANQQTENGTYALQLLTDDLRNAGYLGTLDPTPLPTPVVKPDACATDLATLRVALPIAVQGYDDGANAPACITDWRTGTDILVVRRASTCALGEPNCDPYVGGVPYLQVSGCSNASELGSGNVLLYFTLDTSLANLTLHQRDCATAAPTLQFRTHIYFVANNDRPGDGVPTLKRAELSPAGFAIVPLVEGIDDFQVEYGLDTAVPTSGQPAVYTADPDTFNACTPAVCASYWRNVVAAKLYVLSRNNTPTPGYVDRKTYTLGSNAAGVANVVPPIGDPYKRHVYQTVVRLNNSAGRNIT